MVRLGCPSGGGASLDLGAVALIQLVLRGGTGAVELTVHAGTRLRHLWLALTVESAAAARA
ncbi:MAG TPA: hypothetical protein ENN53_07630 [Candidatus Acetothermia bacterium]|nr:hypothetical protein [Candidatus Acetothermia bacterium]